MPRLMAEKITDALNVTNNKHSSMERSQKQYILEQNALAFSTMLMGSKSEVTHAIDLSAINLELCKREH